MRGRLSAAVRFSPLLILLLFPTLLGRAKAATLLPDISFDTSSISLNDGQYTTQVVSSPGHQQESNSNSQVQSSVALTPSPSLEVSGSTNNGQSIGLLELRYYFDIVGPAATVPIPVIVNASGRVGGTSTGKGGFFDSLQSTLQVDGPGVAIAATTPGAPAPGSFNINQSYGFQPNSLYAVTMIAEGAATVNLLGGTASFDALVDPTFSIDPNFSNANLYSIEFSAGVGNSVSPVPLPSTWGMMSIGLISLGFVAHRERRKQRLRDTLGCRRLAIDDNAVI